MADIIAVDEDPRQNIAALLDVAFVMKGGIVYKEGGKRTAEGAAGGQ